MLPIKLILIFDRNLIPELFELSELRDKQTFLGFRRTYKSTQSLASSLLLPFVQDFRSPR